MRTGPGASSDALFASCACWLSAQHSRAKHCSPHAGALMQEACDPKPVVSPKTNVPCRTVDVGIAQLSMHSIREMCGTDDVGIAYKHFVAFFEVGGQAVLEYPGHGRV